jgi:hypothetical protein
MKVSDICVCPVVHPNDIIQNRTRCIGGSRPTHKSCGKTIMNMDEKRAIEDDRPEIEYR